MSCIVWCVFMLLTIPENIQSKGNVNMHFNTLIVRTGEKIFIVTCKTVNTFSFSPNIYFLSISLPPSWHHALHLGLTPAYTAKSLSPTPAPRGETGHCDFSY